MKDAVIARKWATSKESLQMLLNISRAMFHYTQAHSGRLTDEQAVMVREPSDDLIARCAPYQVREMAQASGSVSFRDAYHLRKQAIIRRARVSEFDISEPAFERIKASTLCSHNMRIREFINGKRPKPYVGRGKQPKAKVVAI